MNDFIFQIISTITTEIANTYKLANKEIPLNAFVRVWNLFYICDPDLSSACNKAGSFSKLPICGTENDGAPIVWYGWGGYDERLNLFKKRFVSRAWPRQFYYDHESSQVIARPPTIRSFAKHTQGMPSKPVNEYLANVL